MNTPHIWPKRKAYRLHDHAPITPEFRKAAVELAQRTTTKGAARALGVSCTAVRYWGIALGVTPRRVGAPTMAEVDTFGSDYPSPMFQLGEAPVFKTEEYQQRLASA